MSKLEQAPMLLLARIFNLASLSYQQPQILLDTNDQLPLVQWAFNTAVIVLYVPQRRLSSRTPRGVL